MWAQNLGSQIAKEKKLSFNVSRNNHSSERRFGSGKNLKSFHARRDKATSDRATNSPTKTKQSTGRKDCATIVMSQDI